MLKVILIFTIVSGDGTYDVFKEPHVSQYTCYVSGKKHAEQMLVKTLDVIRVSYKCVNKPN